MAIFSLLFFEHLDISASKQVFDLKMSVCINNMYPEGSISQISFITLYICR